MKPNQTKSFNMFVWRGFVNKWLKSHEFNPNQTKPNLEIICIPLNVCKQMPDANFLLFHINTWNHLTVCKKQ